MGQDFWQIREVFQTIPATRANCSEANSFLYPVYTNNEDELYVSGQTAVWSRGIPLDNDSVPFKCFSMDAPIKFAFFCPRNFVQQNPKYRRLDRANEKLSSFYAGGEQEEEEEDLLTDRARAVCLVDGKCFRVYMSNGEDFLASLEFPVAAIWNLKTCVLFEREATTTTIDQRCIAMPRLFSLRHPLEEMSPVLIKYGDLMGYFSNNEHKIIFSDESLDILLLYDMKTGRHFIVKLRLATEDEVNYVGETSEQHSEQFSNLTATTSHLIPPGSGGSFLLNLNQSQTHARQNLSRRMHQNASTIYNNPNRSTFHSASFHHGGGGGGTPQGTGNKSSARFLSPLVTSQMPQNISKAVQSPLTRLHSSMRHNSFSMQEARNYGQAEPAQPIYPEFCLETIWTEEVQVDRMMEPAAKGFYHTDWIGQRYLCYLLPRQGKLYMVEMNKENAGTFGAVNMIELKEAVCLPVSLKFQNNKS